MLLYFLCGIMRVEKNTEISKEGVVCILAVDWWEAVGDKILGWSDTLAQFLCAEWKELPFLKRSSDYRTQWQLPSVHLYPVPESYCKPKIFCLKTSVIPRNWYMIFFLLLNSYMFRHCRHLQEAYTKTSLKCVTINTNHITLL